MPTMLLTRRTQVFIQVLFSSNKFKYLPLFYMSFFTWYFWYRILYTKLLATFFLMHYSKHSTLAHTFHFNRPRMAQVTSGDNTASVHECVCTSSQPYLPMPSNIINLPIHRRDQTTQFFFPLPSPPLT